MALFLDEWLVQVGFCKVLVILFFWLALVGNFFINFFLYFSCREKLLI